MKKALKESEIFVGRLQSYTTLHHQCSVCQNGAGGRISPAEGTGTLFHFLTQRQQQHLLYAEKEKPTSECALA